MPCQHCEMKLSGKTVGSRMKPRCGLHEVAAEMLLELRAAVLNSDYVRQKYGLSREQCARIRALIVKAGGVWHNDVHGGTECLLPEPQPEDYRLVATPRAQNA